MILNLSMCVTVCMGVCTGDSMSEWTVQLCSHLFGETITSLKKGEGQVVRRLSRLSLFIGRKIMTNIDVAMLFKDIS